MYYPYGQLRVKQTNRVITVIGTGSVTVTPDTFQVQLEVKTENVNLNIAQQENTKAMNEVIEALLNYGLENEHIQTISYNINPQYDYIDGEQRFRGYAVANEIKVTGLWIEKVGNIIDIAVQNGATSVSNIQFFAADDEATYNEALSLALKNATEKANIIAGTLQFHLMPIPIKIVEERRNAPIIPSMFVAKEMSGTTPIEPGQLTIQATVSVKFQF